MRGISRSRPAIVVPGSANARSEIARVIRSEHFDELELVEIRGFTVTSVAETLLCLAGDLSKDRLEELVDDLMLSGQVEPAQLMPVVERETGRRPRGIAFYRELVELRLPYAPQHDASYLERVLVRLLTKARLPDWTREHPFTVDDRGCRVDVYIPSWRLVIEADGRNFHARRLAFEADRRRDNQLAMRGIQVIRLTYEMLTKDPSGCLETIQAVGLVRSA